MKRKSNAKVFIAFVIFALFVLGAFVMLSNRSESIKEEQALKATAVQEVLMRNMETDYPPSPKEVVKYYSEITRCFYGEQYTEEEFDALAVRSREVFDDELVANQTYDSYYAALKMEVLNYKEAGKTISSFSVSNSTDVDYYDYLDDKWAQLYCVYSIRVKTSITPVKEKYLLRQDKNGHWKIYGWVLVEE